MANETINAQSELSSLDTVDFIAVWDTSAGAMKKVSFSNLFNADISQPTGKFFATDKVRALSGSGLRLEDDGGNAAMLVVDGGTARFTGVTSITAAGIDRVDVGVEAGTPRIVLEDAGLAIWVLDNNGGEFRWSTTGNVRMMLTTAGRLAIGNIAAAPTAAYLEVYGGGARVDYDVNTPSFFGRARVGYDGATSDHASFSHLDMSGAGNYAIKQTFLGETWLNAATGQDLRFARNNTTIGYWDTSNNFHPANDNTQDCGKSGSRWNDIWAGNATIQTSDARDKTNVKPSDLGLDFIKALQPISWVWVDRDEPELTETYTDDEGNEYTRIVRPAINRTYKRPHYGLSAQQVKQAMDALGVADFAGYIHDQETDSYALRYTEFIAPIIVALQDLAAQVEALRAKKK